MAINDKDSEYSGPESLYGVNSPHDESVHNALVTYAQFLDAEPITPMPEGVWEHIQTALSLESAESVIDLTEPRQRSLGTKWVGGLVAASVTLLAVGIGANILTSTGSGVPGSTVAGSSNTDPSPIVAGADPELVQAGFVPPAVTVTASGEDYSPQNLTATVTRALNRVGVTTPLDYFRVPVKKMATTTPSGMMQNESTLRNCITELTKSETSQALLVDRGTYLGKEAGIVIIPFAMVKGMDSVPNTAERFAIGQAILGKDSYLSFLDIWVVGPGCGTVAFDVYSHITYSLN